MSKPFECRASYCRFEKADETSLINIRLLSGIETNRSSPPGFPSTAVARVSEIGRDMELQTLNVLPPDLSVKLESCAAGDETMIYFWQRDAGRGLEALDRIQPHGQGSPKDNLHQGRGC